MCSIHYQRYMKHGDTNPLESHDGLRTRHPDEYRSWYAMVRRCTKANQGSYQKYGAKGVELCDRWQGGYGFKNFLEDMGEKPKHGNTRGGMPIYTIDRIDASKGYCPENCVWSSWREQARHRSNTSKHPGVCKHPSGLWCAYWTDNGERASRYCKTFEEAIKIRKHWEKKNPLM